MDDEINVDPRILRAFLLLFLIGNHKLNKCEKLNKLKAFQLFQEGIIQICSSLNISILLFECRVLPLVQCIIALCQLSMPFQIERNSSVKWSLTSITGRVLLTRWSLRYGFQHSLLMPHVSALNAVLQVKHTLRMQPEHAACVYLFSSHAHYAKRQAVM